MYICMYVCTYKDFENFRSIYQSITLNYQGNSVHNNTAILPGVIA